MGRNDEFTRNPSTCKMCSKKLARTGIKHYAEEYIGTQGGKVSSADERILNETVSLFWQQLNF